MKLHVKFFALLLTAFSVGNACMAQQANFTAPDSICVNSAVSLSELSTGAVTFNWFFFEGCNQQGAPNSTAAGPPSFVYTIPGTYSIGLIINSGLPTESAYCQSIVVLPPPTIDLGNDTSFCAGDSVQLRGPVYSGATYTWSTGSDSSATYMDTTGKYWLAISDYGCKASDTVLGKVLPLPSLNLPRDTSFCDSGVVSYLTNQPVTYIWNTGSIVNSTKVTASGFYWLQLNESGCTTIDTVQVRVVSTHQVYLGKDTSFCGSGRLQYPDTAQVTWQWSTGSDSSAAPVLATGPYWLALTQLGCTSRDTINVTVIPQPVVDLGNDTTLCLIHPYTLNAGNNPAGDTYQWQDGSASPTYVVTKPGLFSVAVSGGGCTTTDSILIRAVPTAYFTLGPDQPICPGEIIYLKPSVDTLNYVWQNGSSDSLFKVAQPGTYYVTGSDACGSYKDSVTIYKGVCIVQVPSAFTPNGDGANDVFKVLGTELVDHFALSIYNRYGQKVFETTDKTEGWDGSLHGISAPIGTYIYQLGFRYLMTGQSYQMDGTIMLIR